MPNAFFQFKQFTVWHDRCAMKVGTDGVLLGAWADIANHTSFLDIGCGSGLIALMIAQRTSDLLPIHAIDIEKDAVDQTKENIIKSPFKNIICSETSLQDLVKRSTLKYDCIISNPPYFVSSLKSPQKQRTLARHSDSLSVEELISCSVGLLSERGCMSFIYPYTERDNLLRLADENKLCVSRLTKVYPTPGSNPKRLLIEFSVENKDIIADDLVVEIARHHYSNEFTQLVKDFYLKM